MNVHEEQAPRSERLYVRLTVAEAAHVAYLADARGISVSDFVRGAVLRDSGVRSLAGCRALPTDAAGTIRQLSTIAADLRRRMIIVETNGVIGSEQLDAWVARIGQAIERVAR